MTGATGDLTPDDAEEPFIPAEQREISGLDAGVVEPADEPERAPGGTTPGESDGDEFSDHDEHF